MKASLLLAMHLLLLPLSAQTEPPTPLPPLKPLPSGVRWISPAELAALLESSPQANVLDVRTTDETVEQGRIPAAKGRHTDSFREDFMIQFERFGFDPAQPCVLYCALGGRSRRVAGKAAALGYQDIRIVEGGFNAWKKSGLPVDGGQR